MTYRRRLTVALRARGAQEELITDILREADSLRLDDDSLEREFGTPEAYAVALVPEARRKKRVGPILMGGVVAAMTWIALAVVDEAMSWGLRDSLGPFLLFPALVLLALGVAGQFASDYFRRTEN
jgi:hypothetical protein